MTVVNRIGECSLVNGLRHANATKAETSAEDVSEWVRYVHRAWAVMVGRFGLMGSSSVRERRLRRIMLGVRLAIARRPTWLFRRRLGSCMLCCLRALRALALAAALRPNQTARTPAAT